MKKLLILIGVVFTFVACDDNRDLNTENELLLGDWVGIGHSDEASVQSFLNATSDTIAFDYIEKSPYRMTVGLEKIFFYLNWEALRPGREYDFLKGYQYIPEAENFIVFGQEHRDIRYLSESEVVFVHPEEGGSLSYPIYRKIEEDKEESDD